MEVQTTSTLSIGSARAARRASVSSLALAVPSLDAYKYLRGTMTACSWQAGWRSLLLRAYVHPAEVEEFETRATPDQLLVLVTSGSCHIEARYRDECQHAQYEAGDLGMTRAGEAVTLRWRATTPHTTLQLHIPDATIRHVYQELSNRDPAALEVPSALLKRDPLIAQVMRSLADALSQGVPDLYADQAAHLLAAHLLTHHARLPRTGPSPLDRRRLGSVNAFLNDNLASPISLERIAREAGMSRFHLVRTFKRAYGEAPFQRLLRFRMEEAKRRLKGTTDPVAEIALRCGYPNAANFSSAFRRYAGVTPRDYRRTMR
jgi:AraC family transcriptional regulator